MNRSVDLTPSQFSQHDRALEKRFMKELLRKNEPLSDKSKPEILTIAFAHTTDAVNELLSLLECPSELRSFIDALIGISGYRSGTPKWFHATDPQIAQRASRCEKWVQGKRKELMRWQNIKNVALVEVEDNRYEDGQKTPHKYLVHIALYAVMTLIDAQTSEQWARHKFDEAMLEAAKTMLASLPEVPPIHKRHDKHRRTDPESVMERELKAAVTKVTKAKEINALTGNHIAMNASMHQSITQLRVLLNEIEESCPRECGRHSSVEIFSTDSGTMVEPLEFAADP